ncbi:putative ABC transporter [Desulfosarcina cetonica]|nr:putative ABC transporter [Desulfosarcina cetonica]
MKSLMRLYGFLRPYRIPASISLSLLVAMVAADLLIPRLTQRIIDQGIAAGNLHVVVTTALIMVAASLLSAALAVANNLLSVKVAMAFGADIRSALMRKVQTFSFANLDTLQTGKLIVRSTSDVTTVQTIVMLSLRILTRAPIWAVGAIVLLVVTASDLAWIMVAFVPLIIVLVYFFTHRARPLFLGVQQRLDRLNVVLQENLAGIRVVKAFVRATHEKARFDDANQDLMAGTIGVGRLMAVFHPFMLLILNLAIVAAVWFGGATAITGGMSVGTVVAAINYLSFALFPILMLTGMIGPVSAADASASRILEVLDAQPQARQRPGANQTRITRGQIVFTDVSFSYPGNGAEPALSNISFVAEAGQTVAIVGATGSGKSTLVHLIPRFYDVTAGRITMDGSDIREMDLPGLRRDIGMVLQETVLFSGTVADNIRYGRISASPDAVGEAARVAQADAFIRALPQGYDTRVGQRGVTLSGGQRQRIAIARAILVQPKVLILDDATSALDMETEIRLQTALDAFTHDTQTPMTRLIVAQRISSVLTADTIIVLDHGRVHAMGPHRQLLAQSAVYQDIYRSQLGEPDNSKEHAHG